MDTSPHLDDSAAPTQVTMPYDYVARDYQMPFWRAAAQGYKRFCLVWHRRAGKEKTCWNYMLMKAFWEPGIYYYFFPHFSQGRKIIWDGMDKSGKRFLEHVPERLLARKPNSTNMQLTIKCAPDPKKQKGRTSTVQIIGCNNYDAIVGTNPTGCVFSEYSIQDPNAWQLIRPILAENKGWAIFNFCVAPETLVITENGMQEISEVVPNSKPGFTDIDLNVLGLDGYNKATCFYNGGMKSTLKITTSKGYEITCTPNHPLLSVHGWQLAKDYSEGNYLPIQRGKFQFGRKPLDISSWQRPSPKRSGGNWKHIGADFITPDLFYLMGIVLAEGNIQGPKKGRGAYITVANSDKEVHELLLGMGFKEYRTGTHFTYSGNELASFFEWFGLMHTARNKIIPPRLLLCRSGEIASFLSGYFDGDGCATKRGNIHCDSASKKLIDTLHVLLLGFGIVATKSVYTVAPTKRVRVSSTVYRLELSRSGSCIFFERIGFRIARKQSRKYLIPARFQMGDSDQVPIDPIWLREYRKGMDLSQLSRQKTFSYKKINELSLLKTDPYLRDLLDSNYYYDTIKSIVPCVSPVYDFVIPKTHSFFSNGLISHNTPRGINHGKVLYDMAESNDDWFCQKLTAEDTHAISLEDIDKERQAGMSEDYIQQEFYCSFTLGIEGSYYGWYLQKARNEERIGKVNWSPSTCVNVAMDLGHGDATALVFYQQVGQEIHIIDYYENQGQNFAHYAKIIQDKPYVYGRYYAPSDASSKQLATGLSVQEVSASLGLTLTIIPTVTILIDNGIEAVRSLFGDFWIDETKCSRLIKCLENYQKVRDEKNEVYKERPLHNWASHGSDAVRYLAIAIKLYGQDTRGIDDKEYEKMRNKYLPRLGG